MNRRVLCLLVLVMGFFLLSDCQPDGLIPPDPSDIAEMSSFLARSEPRQLGLLGFTALGAMMFPILVSLGMASFVSHLPTVFKEFASEFGIPATPPRNYFLFRRNMYDLRNGYDSRLDYLLNNIQRLSGGPAASNDNFLKYVYGRSKR